MVLRTLARRYEEMGGLERHLDELAAKANPALRGVNGVAVDVAANLLTAAGENPDRLRNEAAFAALCGVSPVEASSGKVVRRQLNRSRNRQANHALWRIVMLRLTCDERTKTDAARRRPEGKSDRDIVRFLKRYVAREVVGCLTAPETIPAGKTLLAAASDAGARLEENAA